MEVSTHLIAHSPSPLPSCLGRQTLPILRDSGGILQSLNRCGEPYHHFGTSGGGLRKMAQTEKDGTKNDGTKE